MFFEKSSVLAKILKNEKIAIYKSDFSSRKYEYEYELVRRNFREYSIQRLEGQICPPPIRDRVRVLLVNFTLYFYSTSPLIELGSTQLQLVMYSCHSLLHGVVGNISTLMHSKENLSQEKDWKILISNIDRIFHKEVSLGLY